MSRLKYIITILLLTLTMLFTLTSCDPTECDFNSYKILEDVISIQLIDYKNDGEVNWLSWIYGDITYIKPYDFTKEEVIETLDEDRIDSFVKEIKEFGFFIKDSADSASGKSVKIIKNNGYFMIFSGIDMSLANELRDFVVLYNSKGIAEEHFGVYLDIAGFRDCVSSYFELFSSN